MAKRISQKGKIDPALPDLLASLNKQLGSMPYRLAMVNPAECKLAKKNARFMKSETFKSLVANIKKDGNLSSIPFCYKDVEGTFHVLSGNHRIQAAVQADIEQVLIFYRSDLTQSEQIAIQLSHNAIEGQDDLMILKELWESIEDLDFKIYAGIDSDMVKQLDKIQFSGFSEQCLDYKSVSFLFLPEEIDRALAIFDKIESLYKNDDVFIFSRSQWEKFFDVISTIKTACNIKNSAAAFTYLLQLAEAGINDLRPPVIRDSGDQPESAV